jgi:hypothetical protein
MSHLTPDELVNAVDGTLTGSRHDHLTGCAMCRESAARLGHLLGEVRSSDVPEPSPLFWTHFSARVRQAVLEEATPRRAWHPAWLRWSVLTPVTALALVVTALVLSVPHGQQSQPTPVATTAVDPPAQALDDPAPVDDGSWRLVVDMVDGLDLDHATQDSLVVTPGLVERAANDLRPAERDELLRLLRAELAKPEL